MKAQPAERRDKLLTWLSKKYRIDLKEKTVYVPHTDNLKGRYLKELSKKFKFHIQLEIT